MTGFVGILRNCPAPCCRERWRVVILAAFWALVVHASPVTGQNALPTLQQVRQAYEHFAYRQADSLAQVALQNYRAYRPQELAWIHIYRGSALFALGNAGQAKAEFVSALSLLPDLKLDPVYFSPKLIHLLEEARKEIGTKTPPKNPGPLRYILVPDPRPAAAWRSFLLPGWGQHYKGQKRKALWMFAAAGAVDTGLLYFYFKTRSAHRAYLRALQPAEISQRYRTYRNCYRLRNGFAAATVLLWAYSFWDALLFPPKSPVAWHFSAGTLWAGVSWQF